jgi:hypothetical protein
MGEKMKRFALLLLSAIALAGPALAQGQIGTIEKGQYICELPDETGTQAGIEQPEENFRIASASRYRSPQGDGTYLRRGDIVTMSSGPRNGDQYQVITASFLRKIENGEPGRLRCFLRGR